MRKSEPSLASEADKTGINEETHTAEVDEKHTREQQVVTVQKARTRTRSN